MVDLTLPDVAPARDTAGAEQRLVARVLAWHHRNPLACRIGAGDVGGLGVIALPYGPGDAGTAAPLFHQPRLLPGLSHRVLVEFAIRHAAAERPGPADWPQRDIERADAAPEPAPQTRYLLTATVADPRRATPRRVLLAPAGAAVWGRRALDRVRVAVTAALAVLLLASLAVWGVGTALQRPAAAPVPVAAGAAGASAVVAQAPPASASAAPAAPSTASTPQATARPVASAPIQASAPAPMLAAVPALASAPAAPVPPPRLLPMPSRVVATPAASAYPASPSAPAAAAAPAGPNFALVSMPSRKRVDAEATLKRVRQLLGPAIGNLQVQVMPSPQGFVVTLWPLPTQADAERLAEVLARRGVPMKWMEF